MNDKKRNQNHGRGANNNGSRNKKGNWKGKKQTGSYGRESDERCSGSSTSRAIASPGNDLSWYTNNPALVAAAANFPFSHVLGDPAPSWGGATTHPAGTQDASVPGIMVFDTINIPGYSKGNSRDSINVTARKMYAWIRQANSGSTNYESSDLLLYLLAMDELYTWYALGLRVYGLLQNFSYSNRFEPKPLVEALGFDYDDLVENQANFRFILEHFRAQMSALAVPTGYSYFKRHVWLYGNYFFDELSRKRQYYAFKPMGYRIYSPRTNTKGGELVFHPTLKVGSTAWNIGTQLLTSNDYQDICDSLITPLITDEDINIMSGDILKAIGKNGGSLVTWEPVPLVYSLAPIHDPSIMSQISTLTSPNGLKASLQDAFDSSYYANRQLPMFNITQTDGNIVSTVTISTGNRSAIGNDGIMCTPQVFSGCVNSILLNMWADNPTPGDVIEATRLASLWHAETPFDSEVTGDTVYPYTLKTTGSEAVINISVYNMDSGILNNGVVPQGWYLGSGICAYDESDGANSMVSKIKKLDLANAFDHHPIVSMFYYTESDGNFNLPEYATRVYSGMPWDNYTVISDAELERLHRLCVMSMFTAPFMGQFS